MTWPAPGRFKVGDMVTVHDSHGDEPGIVIQTNPHSAFPYRIGGAFTNGQLWDAWFPGWQIAHDLDTHESNQWETRHQHGAGTKSSTNSRTAGGRSNTSPPMNNRPSTLKGSSR